MVTIDDTQIKAIIYDTSGQERFRSIPKGYIRKGDGIVVVYDITDKKSFESITYWINEIEFLRADKPPVIILGNKADLEHLRQVKFKEGKDFADKIGAFFDETSIKDLTSIEHAFDIIIKTIYIQKVESKCKTKNKKDGTKTLSKGHYLNEYSEGAKRKEGGWPC